MHTVHFEHFSRPNEQITLNRYLEPEIQPSHIHDFIEIELVISGSGIHQVGDCRIPVRSGDAFLTNIQTPHCFLSDPKSPILLYNCLFSPTLLHADSLEFEQFSLLAEELLYKRLFPDQFRKVPHVHVFDGQMRLRKVFDTMYQEYIDAQEGYRDILFGCLIQLLVLFLRLYQQGDRQSDRPFLHLLQYLEDNYEKEISLKELSRIAFLSPNHLCKVFKDKNGVTISEFIQARRLEKVCQLLSETELSLSAIAMSVGYQDEGYLRKLFKRRYGVTPSQYRKSEKRRGKS